jgi:hypothetical protein
MVTSHKMKETEMGYRGSKSELKNNFVKEQRVDGSWFLVNTAKSLRYTLKDFERNYQIKVLSKQFNRIKCFSSLASVPVQNSNLNSWFVTGFSDAEASFGINTYLDKRSKKRINWIVKPSFQISLHSKDINLLLQLKTFFGCGIIVEKNNRSEVSFRVNSAQDLTNLIIPHFLKYPLLSQKCADFYLFKEIVDLIITKTHLTEEGLQQIINIRASMNLGLSDLLKSQFINLNPVPRPIINSTHIPNLNWIAGFSSGEGCFLVTISKSNKNKVGKITQLTFKISQHNRDKKLLELIGKHLNCGAVYSHGKNASIFKVSKFEDINNKIIPIFKDHPINGIKQLDYQDFCLIATLMGDRQHLNHEGISNIKLIKDRMNTNRK